MNRFQLARSSSSAKQQQGAALFVALMILILLTMLALSASQVTGLQERMASVYRADTMAFEAAESQLRGLESQIVSSNPLLCDSLPKPRLEEDWVEGVLSAGALSLENLNNATSQYSRGINYRGSSAVGQQRSPGSLNCLIFRMSSYNVDDPANPTSRALVQSTYTP